MEIGYPQKVLADFHKLGVHTDCIIASEKDSKAACERCTDLMFHVIDIHYGHLPKEKYIEEVTKDILRDRLGDVEHD